MKIKNKWGRWFDFDTVVNMMDDEIRESLHNHIAPCGPQTFFDAYCVKHRELFDEDFEFNVQNPQV